MARSSILLVMPVQPSEIMVAKIWANGLAIVLAAVVSLWVVVQGLLGVPIAGSVTLFVAASVVYMVSVTGLGILLATFTTSMPQFGLLALPVLVVMNLLSGSTTPMESMPGLVADHDAAFALDAFRGGVAGHSLSRGGAGDGLA